MDALGAGKVSVGAPFFDAVFIPLMVPMLAVMAAGPMLAWKRGDLAGVLGRLKLAFVLVAAAVVGTLWVKGLGSALAAVGMGVAVWVLVGALVELAERLRLFRVAFGDSLRRLARLPRSALGMTLAHAGLAVAVAGMTASSAWRVESIQAMAPGDTVAVAGYAFTFEGARQVVGPNYTATRGTFIVRRGGQDVAVLTPEKRVYAVEDQPTTEAAIRSSFRGDLYAVIGDPDPARGTFVTRIYFNPLVPWIWAGGLIMALGGLVSLTDRRHRVGAPVSSRASARADAAKA